MANFRWYLVDIPVLQSTLEFDAGFNVPAAPLVLSKTGQQTIDGEQRTYYAANPPTLLIVVFRSGLKLEDLTDVDRKVGQVFIKTLVGWDDGRHGFTSRQGAGQRHSKLTIDLIYHAPPFVFAEDYEPLSKFVAGCPQLRSVGRPIMADGPTSARNITLPESYWQDIERLGAGNRSAGVRTLYQEWRDRNVSDM